MSWKWLDTSGDLLKTDLNIKFAKNLKQIRRKQGMLLVTLEGITPPILFLKASFLEWNAHAQQFLDSLGYKEFQFMYQIPYKMM